jgi:TATA-box binding protein (TBP) (component of TFIID and TFIIIB)
MSVSILGMNQSVELKNITITLKREDSYEYLIFPKKAWRVSDVQVDVSALDMFNGG